MRSFLYFQDYSSSPYSKATIDNLLAAVDGKVSDIFVAARPDGYSETWFNSTRMAMRTQRIDGLPAGRYFIQAAAAHGVRVHAWLYVGYWGTWAKATPAFASSWNMKSLSSPCNAVGWVNFATPACRTAMVDVVESLLVDNPGLAGFHLDYCRIHSDAVGCTAVDKDDITAWLQELRNRLRGRCELSAAVSGKATSNTATLRDPVAWLDLDLVDTLTIMSYTDPVANRLAYIGTFPRQERIAPGVSTVDPSGGSEATRLAQLTPVYNGLKAAGYDSLSWFDSRGMTPGVVAVLDELEETPPPPPPPGEKPLVITNVETTTSPTVTSTAVIGKTLEERADGTVVAQVVSDVTSTTRMTTTITAARV